MEEFRDVVGYEGLYKVSNTGKVLSVVSGKLLKPGRRGEYLFVVLSSTDKHNVHRLVAQAFIPNPDRLPCVNHKDENKLNNCASNLEWCSRSYNKAYSNGRLVEQILDGIVIKTFMSVHDAAIAVNGSSSLISRCCRGEPGNRTAYGYTWRWSDAK